MGLADLLMRHRVAAVALGVSGLGLFLGLSLDANAAIPQPWNRVSSVLGWVYFVCWGAEFYPQVLLNHARRSTDGYSLDSAVLAILGFASYAVFNCAFYYSQSVQDAYMARHDGSRSAVELNDVFFALHATLMVAVAITQCWVYPSTTTQGVSRTTKLVAIVTLGVAAAFALAIFVTARVPGTLPLVPVQLNVLDLLYYLSYVKLGSTLVKELPQLLLNYRRKSTVGWTVGTVLLDIPGCVLSIAQQVLDSWATDDWSAITGNPVKFLLAFASLVINTVYILQHYVWFAHNNRQLGERSPLLPVSTKASVSQVAPTFKSPTWVTHAVRYNDDHAVDKAHWDHTAELARV